MPRGVNVFAVRGQEMANFMHEHVFAYKRISVKSRLNHCDREQVVKLAVRHGYEARY